MNKLKIGMLALVLILGLGFTPKVEQENFRNGDIVFQDSESLQSQAIKLATNSNFSHCGIVFSLNDTWMVLEAVQPVRVVSLEEWINQGTDGKYEKRRLKTGVFTDKQQDKMWEVGSNFLGKNYDIFFKWDDEQLYCSELVWKIFERGAGIRLTEPKMLKEYNLDSKIVKDQLKQRYGADVPLNRNMVSPQDIYESNLLE